MAMAFNYPAEYNTWLKRMGLATGVKEVLRRLHNAQGAKVKAGTLTIEEFRNWVDAYWLPRHNATLSVLNVLKFDPPAIDAATIESKLDTLFI